MDVTERYLYGLEQLGFMKGPNTVAGSTVTLPVAEFEIHDHLGNVRATVLDDFSNAPEPILTSNNNYYAFGSLQPDRSNNSLQTRHGFNGQMMDNDINGLGNHNTALYWEYDPRIARRWNLDPVIRPWESPYAVFGGNPIWNTDHDGDDFVNVHTERKEKAKVSMDAAAGELASAESAFGKYAGMSKDDVKSLKENDKASYNEYRTLKDNVSSAQKKYNNALARYNQEVKYEAIVNSVLKDFQNVNPQLYAEWDKFDPFGRGVIDINVSAQNDEIIMLDSRGFPTGQRTTEGINARLGTKNKADDYVRIRLQVIKSNDVIKVISMTGTMVHALGHVEGGKQNDEDHAINYEVENYQKKRSEK